MSGAFAWVTLLTQSDYLRGVETLRRSLRASGSPWPLVVMVTPAIDDKMRQHLQTQGCRVQEVPVIGPDPALAHRYANERFAEQDFLNEVFRERWLPLHYGYNALKTLALQHPQMWDLTRVKNIHYIIDKPWEKTPQPGDKWYELDKLWWEYA